MRRKMLLLVILSSLCVALVVPQEWKPIENVWTDKNNTEDYARYLMMAAYAEHGYSGAKIQIMQEANKRLFIVDPGQLFHVKEIVVNGAATFSKSKLLEDAPKPGDIYIAGRENEWIQKVRQKYAGDDGPLKLVNWGVRLDRANARATIEVTLQER